MELSPEDKMKIEAVMVIVCHIDAQIPLEVPLPMRIAVLSTLMKFYFFKMQSPTNRALCQRAVLSAIDLDPNIVVDPLPDPELDAAINNAFRPSKDPEPETVITRADFMRHMARNPGQA